MMSLRDSLKVFVTQPLSWLTFFSHVVTFCLRSICPQTNHRCHVSSDTDRDAGVHLYPQPGSPLAGLHHYWNFRVGGHPEGEAKSRSESWVFIEFWVKITDHRCRLLFIFPSAASS